MIRRPPRSTPLYSSAASDVYKRQPGCTHGREARDHLHLARPHPGCAQSCRTPSVEPSSTGGRLGPASASHSVPSVKNLALSMSRLVVAVLQQLAMGADVASW